MKDKNQAVQDRNLEELIADFCEIVLTKEDGVDFNKGASYINSLTSAEKKCLNSATEEESCFFVRKNLFAYIQSYRLKDYVTQKPGSPFLFDNGSILKEYKKHFENTYKNNNDQANLPGVFAYTFSYIKEMSEHYRVFEQFYIIRSQETTANILADFTSSAEEQAQKAVKEGLKAGINDAAEKAAEKAAKLAEKQANIAATSAELAAQKAKDAAQDAVELAISNEMKEVNKFVSQTSVTILGIFASIVLTVVGNLVYSSSVLENINAANFYKLVCISALIGFVCFNLIAVMFLFIDRIRNGSITERPIFGKTTVFVNTVLLIIMLAFGVLQFYIPNDNNINKQVKTQEISSKTIEISGTIDNVQHETLTESEIDDKKE